jgi:hypothetical protein
MRALAGMVALFCFLVCTMSTTSGCSLSGPGLKTSVVKDHICNRVSAMLSPCSSTAVIHDLVSTGITRIPAAMLCGGFDL